MAQKLVFIIPQAARDAANDCLLFSSTGDSLRAGGASLQCIPVGGFYETPNFSGIAYEPADQFWTSITVTHRNCISTEITAIDYAGPDPAGIKINPTIIQSGGFCDGGTEAELIINIFTGFGEVMPAFFSITLLFIFFRFWNKILNQC